MEDCIFCKIINGSVTCMKIYEDKYSIAFMDIANDVDGHIVAIPKLHKKNILDCDEDTLVNLIKAVKTISVHLIEKCGYNGVNLLNASDESAGQSVPHFHIHIIPRKTDDNINAWPHFEGAKKEIQEVYRKITML